jgi:hypothetical protein
VKTLRWLRWWWRARDIAFRADGVRMSAAANGYALEVVLPRWWDVRRWWVWLRAEGELETMLPGRRGHQVFARLRARLVPPPKPAAPPRVRVGEVDPRALAAAPDPAGRLVPDDVLEREGRTHDYRS